MPTKQQKEITGQFGVRVPKGALIIEPLDNGPGVHWLSNNAGIKARFLSEIKKREANKRFQRFEFCPTGKGGGVDPTCSPSDDQGGSWYDESEVVAYHGTAEDHLRDILKEGLVTGKFNNWAYQKGFEKNVYVAKNLGDAMTFGTVAAQTAGDDEYAIIKVRIPKGVKKPLDERLNDEVATAFKLPKVPVEWMESATVYKKGGKSAVREIKLHANAGYHVVYMPVSVKVLDGLKKYHLPGQHDQLDHGNWASGEKSPVSQLPKEQRQKFLELENTFAGRKTNERAAIAWSDGSITEHQGDRDSVEFQKAEQIKMIEDGNVIMTHNHPDFGKSQSVAGLSIPDIRFAMKVNAKEIRAVVNHPSGDYVFSMIRGDRRWPPPNAVEDFTLGDDSSDESEKYARLHAAFSARTRLSSDPQLYRNLNLAMSHARAKLMVKYFNKTHGSKVSYRMVKISDKNVRA